MGGGAVDSCQLLNGGSSDETVAVGVDDWFPGSVGGGGIDESPAGGKSAQLRDLRSVQAESTELVGCERSRAQIPKATQTDLSMSRIVVMGVVDGSRGRPGMSAGW